MRAVALGFCALLLGACTVEEVRASDPNDVKPVAASRIDGRFAQAGATFRAEMDGSIGTQASRVGDTFTATVKDPVVDDSGRVLVPRGAKLYGRVTGITREATGPRLRVGFSDVTTTSGERVPIDARIVDIQSTTYASERSSPSAAVVSDSVGNPWMGYDSVLQSPSYSSDTYVSDLAVASGSEMKLELTRPLLAPGSRYRAP
jgi:hypothetical protein